MAAVSLNSVEQVLEPWLEFGRQERKENCSSVDPVQRRKNQLRMLGQPIEAGQSGFGMSELLFRLARNLCQLSQLLVCL
jgi:hypothetical protein